MRPMRIPVDTDRSDDAGEMSEQEVLEQEMESAITFRQFIDLAFERVCYDPRPFCDRYEAEGEVWERHKESFVRRTLYSAR